MSVVHFQGRSVARVLPIESSNARTLFPVFEMLRLGTQRNLYCVLHGWPLPLTLTSKTRCDGLHSVFTIPRCWEASEISYCASQSYRYWASEGSEGTLRVEETHSGEGECLCTFKQQSGHHIQRSGRPLRFIAPKLYDFERLGRFCLLVYSFILSCGDCEE